MSTAALPKTRSEWRKALDELPPTPDNIPAFFFGHGSPMLVGSNGPLAQFLEDFGPKLLEKYKPKGIVVFSAHWEEMGQRLGVLLSDYLSPQLLTYVS